MGGFAPIMSGVTKAVTLANTINAAAGIAKQWSGSDADAERAAQKQAENALKAEQRLEERTAAQNLALEKAKIKAESDAASAARQDALRRAVAKRRAAFGASGIAADDGSAEAVLLGLSQDSDRDAAERQTLDTLKLTALDDSFASLRARNLLELSELQGKNAIRDLSRIG